MKPYVPHCPRAYKTSLHTSDFLRCFNYSPEVEFSFQDLPDSAKQTPCHNGRTTEILLSSDVWHVLANIRYKYSDVQ
jgi:hypothetical protein